VNDPVPRIWSSSNRLLKHSLIHRFHRYSLHQIRLKHVATSAEGFSDCNLASCSATMCGQLQCKYMYRAESPVKEPVPEYGSSTTHLLKHLLIHRFHHCSLQSDPTEHVATSAEGSEIVNLASCDATMSVSHSVSIRSGSKSCEGTCSGIRSSTTQKPKHLQIHRFHPLQLTSDPTEHVATSAEGSEIVTCKLRCNHERQSQCKYTFRQQSPVKEPVPEYGAVPPRSPKRLQIHRFHHCSLHQILLNM